MNREIPFTYAVLRYVHDIATGEFVNVGVALLAPRARYLGVQCVTSMNRVARMFPDLKGEALESVLRTIRIRFEKIARESNDALDRKELTELARSILPRDDSSLTWGATGSGLTNDPKSELFSLFQRLVQRYDVTPPVREADRHFHAGVLAIHNTASPSIVVAGDMPAAPGLYFNASSSEFPTYLTVGQAFGSNDPQIVHSGITVVSGSTLSTSVQNNALKLANGNVLFYGPSTVMCTSQIVHAGSSTGSGLGSPQVTTTSSSDVESHSSVPSARR